MRIGYDAKRLFHNTTGLGQYSRTLLKDISKFNPDQESILFSSKIKKSSFQKIFANKNFTQVELGKWGNVKRVLGFRELLKAQKVDIFHGLSNELPYNIGTCNIPSIVTIHDVIFKVLPNTYSSFDRAIYNYKTRMACKNANLVVAISEQTKRDLIEYFKVDEDKIKVVYQTCHDRFKVDPQQYNKARIADELPKEYFIQVGSINERKNLLNTVKAMYEIPIAIRPHLVIVGRGSGDYYNKLIRYIDDHDMASTIHIYDDIDDDELPYLYHRAICSIYISNYEGFGIPVIESLFCGTPVITSETSSMPEALGGCGKLVDPNSVDSIRKAIQNPPKLDNLLTQEHLTKFDAESIVEQWNKIYRSLV